jgi:hypothetical protein
MGSYRMGPPLNLVLAIRDAFKVETFVETGTFKGETAAWAAGYFRRVVTIEAAMSFAAEARKRFADGPVEVQEGNSVARLPELLKSLSQPAVFWLDAHWSGGVTAGQEDECPLLEEIRLLNGSRPEHFILVDDARLFSAPPPQPHDPAQWPALGSVIPVLEDGGRRHVVLMDDVFIAVPASAREFIIRHCQGEFARRAKRPAWITRLQRVLERFGRTFEGR